jgi:hypothetical protein
MNPCKFVYPYGNIFLGLVFFLFIGSLCARAPLSAELSRATRAGIAPRPATLLEVIRDIVPVYPAPGDSLQPLFMAREKQIYSFCGSGADDSGKIWFCLRTKEGRLDSGLVLAENLRYVSVSHDSTKTLLREKKDNHKRQMERYNILRKNSHWPRRIIQAVRKGEVVLYMTEEQLKASWGDPEKKVNGFIVGIGKHAVWFYFKQNAEKAVAVFICENKVIGWTEE